MSSVESLTDRLGIEFRDKSLLDIALLHRSYSSAHQIAKDNERLEFLGDSILNACVTDIIFRKFPDKDEGDLTKIRARLVSRKALRVWGEELGLGDYILISEKMKEFVDSSRTHIIENAMEAVIGAIYLDRGYDTVYGFIKSHMIKQDFHKIVDFKSRLQELTVERYGVFPEYRVVSETGPPHRKEFMVTVSIKGKEYGTGTGSSKKEAQQEAAGRAYAELSDDYQEENND